MRRKRREIILPLYFGWQLRVILSRARSFKRYWQEATGLFLLVALAVSGFLFYQSKLALGATYTWVQTDWSAGVDNGNPLPIHGTNQTGWAKYNTLDATTNASGTAGQLAIAASASSSLETNDTHFNAGTNSSTTVSGSGTAANVTLSLGTASWSPQSIETVGSIGSYTSVKAVNANTVFISYYDTTGDSVKFAKTTDGGSTWSTTTVDKGGGTYTSIAAVNSNDIFISYVAGNFIRIATSTDGGTTWSTTTAANCSGSPCDYTSLSAASATSIFVAYRNSGASYLMAATSTNGGSTWTASSNGLSTISGHFNSIAAVNATTIFISANSGGGFNLATSTNGGSTWTASTIDAGGGNYSSIAAVNANTLFVAYQNTASNDLKLATSTNGGSSWTTSTVDPANSTGFYPSINALDANNIFISYQDRTNYNLMFAKSTNGGLTWSTSSIDASNDSGMYSSISVVTANTIFASYYEGTALDLKIAKYTQPYDSSGNFTSGNIDLGQNSNLSTLTWTGTTPTNTVLKFQLRTATNSVALSSATWYGPTGTADYYTSSGTNINSTHNGGQWLQYKAFFTTTDTATSSTFSDITVNYTYYPASVTLTSSMFNSSSTANVLSKIQWTETLATGTDIKFQLRTSNSSSTGWSNWCGPDNSATGCDTTTYFTDPSGGETVDADFRDGSNDQWFQYKVWLETTDKSQTSTLSDVTLTYVVNAAPQFSSVSASQSTTTNRVEIAYSVRDTDTSSSSQANQYKIWPSFEYSTNSGSVWTSISSSTYLASGDGDSKTVAEVAYNNFTASWNAKAQIPGTYDATAQIRVTIDDHEAANNQTRATTSLVIDTKNPTISTSTFDSTTDTISLVASDNTNIQYVLSNNSDLSADGTNTISGQWQSAGAVSTTSSLSWNATGSPSFETIYLQVKDAYNNTTSASIVTPSMPTGFNVKDTSNPTTQEYREFVYWGVYSGTTSAQFSKYELYRSTDGSSYSLRTTITASSTNYYLDESLSSSTVYYYKTRIVDTNNDISEYTSAATDTPNGQGGTDVTAPTISSIASSTVQATWAKITWTTDEVSDSRVDYSVSPSTAFGTSASSSTMVTSHEVILSGLTPGTTYLFRVKSKDIFNNQATDDRSGSGYAFTTLSGPTVSEVAVKSVDNQSAAIVWNTNTSSDSYVVYSTVLSNVSGNTNTSQTGSATRVDGPPYQHEVSLTGLSSRTTYYFYVKSTDAGGNTSSHTNSGSYYYFTTTYDTKSPVISSISTPVAAGTSFMSTWTTDELADSQVEYGTVSGTYSQSTTLDSTLSIKHAVSVTGLNTQTAYYFRVKSTDAQGNATTSNEQTVTTTAAGAVMISGGGGIAPTKDSSPPNISDIKIEDVGISSALVSFSTNEPTTAFVLYGKDDKYGDTAGSYEMKTSHKVRLSGLKFGTAYHLQVKAQDSYANFRTSEDKTFTTKFVAEAFDKVVAAGDAYQFQDKLGELIESALPSLSPPFIEKPEVIDITENSAVIKWQTNIPTYGAVSYASEADFDQTKDQPYVIELSQSEVKSREHSLLLKFLEPATFYHFQVKSFALPEVVGKTADFTFNTKSLPVTPQVIDLKKDSLKVFWKTDKPTNSIVEYKNRKTGEAVRKIDETLTTDHFVLLENLNPDTAYEIKTSGYNKKGALIESSQFTEKTSKDITPPSISSIKIDNTLIPGRTDRVQTILRWLTNEPANSAVFFEEGARAEEKLANVTESDIFATEHVVILPALKPGTLYRVKIASSDEAGNLAETKIRSIITPRYGESVTDVIIRNFESTFDFLRKLR